MPSGWYAGISTRRSASAWRITTTSERSRPPRRPDSARNRRETPSGGPGWCFFDLRQRCDRIGRINSLRRSPQDFSHAKTVALRRQDQHLGRTGVFLDHRVAHPAHLLGSLLALRAGPPARVGFRCNDHDVRDAVHDGRRLYAGEKQPRARGRHLRLLHAAGASGARPDAVYRVLHTRGRRARLGRVHLCRGIVGDQRALEHHRRRPARLSLQDGHPARRSVRADAGNRRDRPLRHLPETGRMAVARGGRPGSRRRQTEGNGAREGRGYREARSVRRAAGAAEMKLRKELWFGFSLMALIIIPVIVLTPWGNLTNGHLGLIMLALICVGIMLGFPTAFTLMGMGVFFAWLAYRSVNPALADRQVLDLFVQRTYGVMSNDVLIAIPLFLFMGYLVERAQLIDKLFRSLHLATARVPGSLAVATIVTCAIFATATGIVGAVVTLMGLLAFPAMLKAGYNVKVAAGAVTAAGCLGILIPPSVLLIVYGAGAGVSGVQLYAGGFLPR